VTTETNSYEVVKPVTGELVDLSTATTTDLAAAVLEAREVASVCRRFIAAAGDVLGDRLDYEGVASTTVGEWGVAVGPATERVWDYEKLEATLDRLVTDEVISAEKADKCVRHKPEVRWSEIKRLLESPRTREAVEACYEDRPVSSRRVTVKSSTEGKK
jgi:hypothetical protein